MSNVFTVTTELKLNKEYNQLAGKYISDYIELFNKIQRLTFHRIKNYYIKNGKITLEDRNIIHAQLKEEFNLTSRAIDAILSNMLGRYESIKELKEFERKSLERKISTLKKDLTKLKDERTLQRVSLNNSSKDFNFTKYKSLKIKIYWKQNRLNTKKQKLKNLEKEIETGKYKVCFGTKNLLKKDYSKFIKKRDSEIYYLGRAGDKTCNNNFQVEYNSKINQFYFRIRKEIDLDNDKFVYGQFNFNNKNYTNLLKNLLRTKESALTYRIKIKENKVLLQIIYNFEHNKDLCVTRDSYGVVGVDFNKGFVSVSETDKYGNLINTFNIDYQYSKGNQTTNDFQYIATRLKDYCLNVGKDLVIEKLNFTKKKDNLISKRCKKKYNEMLSSLAYSKFDSIITSKCVKNRIFLHKVNPAWTSWIAKQKYCPKMKLNIHSGASYVIARRGMFLKDKVK